MKSCYKCHLSRRKDKWDDCSGKDWYSYFQIYYCPYQVKWVLENLLSFALGRWPAQPRIIEPEQCRKRAYSAEAGFIKCRVVLADIFSRLDQTGKDGDSLVDAILDGVPIAEFDDDQREAFHFTTGWMPKKSIYKFWKAQREYRRKNRATQSTTRRLYREPIPNHTGRS